MASRENFYLVEQMVINYDVFTISETWLDPSICDSDIHIPGYMLFRQERGVHKKGGGLIVYIKNMYKTSMIENWSFLYPDTIFNSYGLKFSVRNLNLSYYAPYIDPLMLR